MPGREFSSGGYRYGFNAQAKDDEIFGVAQYLDFKFRGYNSRLGRFFAVDPLTRKYPWYSPYQFAGNTPIWARELEGLEEWHTNDGSTASEAAEGQEESVPTATLSGPLSAQTAKDAGYVEYGVLEKNSNFSDEEIRNFTDWNSQNQAFFNTKPGGHCLGAATMGAEKLTGGNAEWKDSNGNLDLEGKHAWQLGSELEQKGYAEERPTSPLNETGTVLKNTPPATNSVFLLGPAGAYHSIILSYNSNTQTGSIYDQGTGWDKKDQPLPNLQLQINEIDMIHEDWGSRMWQLNKVVEKRYPAPMANEN